MSAPAAAANCYHATGQGSTGPADWQTYCWLDLTTYNDATARSTNGQAFSFNLPDGTVMTFRLKVAGAALSAVSAPSWSGAAVGNTAFLGIAGEPILYQTTGGTSTITISSIVLTPAASGTVTNYMLVAADAESSNNGESLSFQTNGAGWQILDRAGPTSGSTYPTISGAGTSTFTQTGVAGTVGSYIVGSTAPTQVTTTLVGGGLQGAMFALRFASILLNTQISGTRIAPADQFAFSIKSTLTGLPLASGASNGTGLGPFTAAALSSSAALPLTLSQAMTGGSANPISKYRSVLNCTNSTSGSSTPLPSNLETTSYNFGPLAFGDIVRCTFTETPYPHITLIKALGSDRRFNSDQFTLNIDAGTTTIATTTTTGTASAVANGSTGQVQVAAGTVHTLYEVGAGATSLDQYTATMACSNLASSSSTVLPTSPGDTVTPQMGDIIQCTITNVRRSGNATLSIEKTSLPVSDPVNGTTFPKLIPGSIVRYAISVQNSGNQSPTANSVQIIDALPPQIRVGTASSPSFIQGTPTSNLSFNPSTDVRYSNATTAPASFSACTYTPVAAYDPNVRFVCLNPKGTMARSFGTPTNFTITFDSLLQ